MIPRRVLPALAALSVIAVFGAVRAMQPPPDYRETLYLFGTLVEVEIHGVSDSAARAAVAGIAASLQRMHRDWHAWQPGELMRLNTAIAAGTAFEADPQLAQVLAQGRSLSCESEGLFDPAIGGLIGLWGFHADTLPEGPPPSDAAVAALLAGHPRMTDLHVDGTTVRSDNPAVQLDLGAYAKGAALDIAAAELQAAGIEDAVLNAGGGVQVIGDHGARPWRVAIRDPFQWGVVAAVDLQPGEALHTSGNYERYLEQDGLRLSHIIDPRSGRPVQGIVSASVIDADGARADAASTALSVAGAGDWPRIAARMGVTAVMMITDDGEIFATPAMRARIEPVAGGFPARVREVPLPAIAPDPACAGF